MQPKDLFLEVAKSQARLVEEPAEQRERLREAWRALFDRAASVFDCFEAIGQIDSEEQVDPDLIDERRLGKTTKKIIEFDVPASPDLANLIDPQHVEDEITVNVKIACEDLAYSDDQGANWGMISRCDDLRILTTVITWKDGDSSAVIQRLERYNGWLPWTDNLFSKVGDSGDSIPESNYFHPLDEMSRIEGFHGGLDLAEQYLAGPNLA